MEQPSQHRGLLAVSEREESLDSHRGIMWGVTPTEKGLRFGKVEKVFSEGEGEGSLYGKGEEGLYGMVCVCVKGSVFNEEGGK